jgi:hypothetical protein
MRHILSPRGFIEQYIIVVPSEYIEGIFSNHKSLIHGAVAADRIIQSHFHIGKIELTKYSL